MELRSSELLTDRFKKHGASTKEGANGDSAEHIDADLPMESVKGLLKALDAPFQSTGLVRILEMMVKQTGKAADGAARDAGPISSESFVKVCLANNFHAVSSTAFKEMNGLASATGVMMAVSRFAKKLPNLGKRSRGSIAVGE